VPVELGEVAALATGSPELDCRGRDHLVCVPETSAVRGRVLVGVELPSRSVDEIGVVEERAERVFRRHYAQIYRFVRRRTASDQQAEDITQDVFVDVSAAGERLNSDRASLTRLASCGRASASGRRGPSSVAQSLECTLA
jgi:hypothetical protein